MLKNLNTFAKKNKKTQSLLISGLNECHNGILNLTVIKTIEDVGCSFDDALGCSVSAKNILHNINGFSPNQFVFGYNASVCPVLESQLPTFEGISSSRIGANNLNALHAARRTFVQDECLERLQRALCHQICPSTGTEFTNSDWVYFKRDETVKTNRFLWNMEVCILGFIYVVFKATMTT